MVMTLALSVMVMVFYWESSTVVGGEDWRVTTMENSTHSSSSLLSIDRKQSDGSYEVSFPSFTEEQGRRHILDLFKEAGVDLTPEMEEELPSWSQVQKVVGPHPYIVGLERCEAYRRKVPPLERMLGSAGMFNSGTNLATHLLKQNCEIPERRHQAGPHKPKEAYGMRWQVPWGKVCSITEQHSELCVSSHIDDAYAKLLFMITAYTGQVSGPSRHPKGHGIEQGIYIASDNPSQPVHVVSEHLQKSLHGDLEASEKRSFRLSFHQERETWKLEQCPSTLWGRG